MNDKKTRRLILTALFTALTCVATLIIRIPTPSKGYVNLGDCMVLMSAWVLEPAYGAAAAGIGSMLADVFASYTAYAPATLVIKALMAVAAALIFKAGAKSGKAAASRFLGGAAAEIIMVGGYFLFEAVLYGAATGALGIPANIGQGIFGLVSAIVLYRVTGHFLKGGEN